MSARPLTTYSDFTRRVSEIVKEMDKNDDVDRALELYEEAVSHINECESRLQNARGRFEEINATLVPTEPI